MATPYKITITKAGVSTDLFNILYDVVGNSNYNTASSPCGTPATLLTQAQLISGFTVSLPDNAVNVYIQDIGGICDGRVTLVLLPGRPTPTVTPSPTVTGTPTPSPSPSTTPNPTPSPSPSTTPGPTPSPSPSTTPGPTPSPSPSTTPNPTPSPSPSTTPNPTPSPSPSTTPNPTPSPSPSTTPNPTPSPTVTGTPTPSPSPSVTPEPTPSPSPSVTPEPTPSPSPSTTPNPTPSPTVTGTPTPSPSTTPNPTPSPTPTITPVTLSTTAGCTGGPGTGTILANNFAGGTDSFEFITISDVSAAEALTKLDNSATRTLIEGATEYTFTSLGNATYYVAIMDYNGNKGVSTATVVNCINPPTPSPTVTPGPTPTPTVTPNPTPTSTPFVHTYSLGSVTSGGGYSACSEFEFLPVNFYSFTSPIGNNVVLYTNNNMNILAANGFYSNGVNFWQITDGNGTLTGETSCIPPTPSPTPNPSPTPSPVYYQLLDCGNSSVHYSIAYTPGTFTNSLRCTAVSSGFPTRTVVITGFTTTTPPDPLYTLTSQGANNCAATPTPTTTPSPTVTPGPTPTVTPNPTPTSTPFVHTYSLGSVTSGGGYSACSEFEFLPVNFYSFTSPIGNNVVLYTNNNMNILAANGFYSNGVNFWQITDGNGTLTGETSCIPPTPSPTPNPSPSPTPEPTAIPAQFGMSSGTTGANACSNWNNLVNRATYYAASGTPALANGVLLYTTVDLNPANIIPEGIYSDGSNYWSVSAFSGVLNGQSTCATPNPTATPVPTPSPTPNPTATPSPTPNPTATPQPTISVNFHTSQPSGYLACDGGTSISIQINGSTFCNSTVYTSSYFTGLGTNNFWLSYDGNYRQIFHNSGANTATQAGSCQTCNNTPPATPEPTPSPTPAPTATPGTWSMVNTSGDVDVSGMTINSAVVVTSGAFPSTPSTTILGTCQTGTNTLVLTFVTSNLPYQSITVIDSNGAVQTQSVPSGYAAAVNFPNVFINTTTQIQIIITETPPATPVPTPEPTPNPTATPEPTPVPTQAPTPEPTPEPTATSAPTVYYYTANKYYGDGTCSLYANNVVVYSTFSVPFNTWACGDTGYMYFITGETSAGSYDADLVSTKSDCSDGCP